MSKALENAHRNGNCVLSVNMYVHLMSFNECVKVISIDCWLVVLFWEGLERNVFQ